MLSSVPPHSSWLEDLTMWGCVKGHPGSSSSSKVELDTFGCHLCKPNRWCLPECKTFEQSEVQRKNSNQLRRRKALINKNYHKKMHSYLKPKNPRKRKKSQAERQYNKKQRRLRVLFTVVFLFLFSFFVLYHNVFSSSQLKPHKIKCIFVEESKMFD